jgi:outer membrane receptor protein involved in Fe transport
MNAQQSTCFHWPLRTVVLATIFSITAIIFSTSTTFGQFGGPGGGGPPGGGMGGFGGDNNGKASRSSRQGIPGTDMDTRAKGNGKIAGILLDSISGKPVEYATVALIDTKTNKPIDGTTADDKGRFSLTKLAPGEYKIQATFLGYTNKTVNKITVERGSDLNIGILKLAPDVRMLNEVNVTGQANIIEEKVDRLVYNADKDISSKGGDAADVMRKVPMLSVDLDGNVSLRGSSNIKVLINNKPSTIVAASVADALKQIPADMIKSIEVITSPSAKYDAEGSAGIINIVTKKTTLQGLTLDVNGGAGNRGALLGLQGNYRTGKMGFNLGGFGRAEYNVKGAFENTQTTGTFPNQTKTIQTANTLTQRLMGNYQLGWDYDIDPRTSLTASIRYGLRNGITNQNNLMTQTFLPTLASPLLADRNVKTTDLSGTVDANLSYTKTYKPQQEFSILGLFSRNNRQNNFTADILGGTDFQTIMNRQKNDNPSYNQESTLQIDYQTPTGQRSLLEFGGKGIFRQVNSDYQYYLGTGATGEFVIDNTRANNSLNYDQNIAASYLSYTVSTKSKFTIKAGARYEYTFLNARFGAESANTPISLQNYGNLVPSINISKNLKAGKTIKLAYNRRLQRPGIQFLNPNVNVANPTNISKGNPSLSPELTDNVEFGFSAPIKKFYVNAAIFARRTNNSITSVRDTTSVTINGARQTAIITNFQNVGHEDTYGLNLFGNVTLMSKLQIGGGIDLFHTSLTNANANPNYTATNSGWVLAGRVFSNLTLPGGWGIQANGGMRGKQIQLQGYQGTFAFYSLGVRKDFNQKKASLGIAAENFLNHPFNVRSETISNVLNQSSVNSFYNAGVRVTFSYKLGKMIFTDGPKKRKSVNNDDVKGEGGGGNDAGGGQQAAPAAGGTRGPR